MMTLQHMAFIFLMATFYTAYFIKMMQQRREGVQTMILGEGDKPKHELRVEKALKLVTFLIPAVQLYTMWHYKGTALPIITWLGVAVSALGVVSFISGMMTMKSNWRAGIPQEGETSLVTHGVFRFSRNPAFLGFDLLYIGILMAYHTTLLSVITIIAIYIFHQQIMSEERFLTRAFGEAYTAYASRVGRYFGRPRREKTRKERVLSVCRTVGIVCAFLIAFPLWFHWDKEKVYDANGVTIYAGRSVNVDDVKRIMHRADSLMQRHGVKVSDEVTYIFTDSHKEFKLKNLFLSSDALATNWPIFDIMVFAPVDFKADLQSARRPILSRRSVSSVMAHELTHTYQRKSLGIAKYKHATIMSKWKTEGMAEYVSESSSVPSKKGVEYFLANRDNVELMTIRPEYFYFRAHLKTDYLLRHKKVSLAQFWENDYDEDALEDEIRQALRSKSYYPAF